MLQAPTPGFRLAHTASAWLSIEPHSPQTDLLQARIVDCFSLTLLCDPFSPHPPPPFLCRYDFYLVSQTTNRGTVNPTYYNVIYDDNGLKPDHMQRLTFKLCHLYYNWQVSNSCSLK